MVVPACLTCDLVGLFFACSSDGEAGSTPERFVMTLLFFVVDFGGFGCDDFLDLPGLACQLAGLATPAASATACSSDGEAGYM